MIKKIINNIPKDKKDHVLLGMFIGYPLMILGYLIDILAGLNFAIILGGVLGVVLVGLKEIVYDWLMDLGTPEWWDFIASAIPIVFPMVIYWLNM
tara:strand:+ start:8270 stop:8554 length:285 start_codon:yes stop_codon:yes gene_type:complete